MPIPQPAPSPTPMFPPSRQGLLALAIGLAAAGSAQAARLEVQVEDIRPGPGALRLALYDKAKGFRQEQYSREVRSLPATQARLSFVFDDLPAGRYALMAYHDEDGNGELNRRFGMFPTEGYGVSNNPRLAGPPSFEETAFPLPEAGQVVTVRMKY